MTEREYERFLAELLKQLAEENGIDADVEVEVEFLYGDDLMENPFGDTDPYSMENPFAETDKERIFREKYENKELQNEKYYEGYMDCSKEFGNTMVKVVDSFCREFEERLSLILKLANLGVITPFEALEKTDYLEGVYDAFVDQISSFLGE